MQILNHHHQRLHGANRQGPLLQQVDGLAPLKLGAHLQWCGGPQPEKVREQAYRLGRRDFPSPASSFWSFSAVVSSGGLAARCSRSW
jgi:hypothetical protein